MVTMLELKAKGLIRWSPENLPRKLDAGSQTGVQHAPDVQAFRLLLANHPIPMWVYDLKTLAFLEVNDAALEKYGYTRDEFLTLTINDIRPMEDTTRLNDHVNEKRPALQHSGKWRHCLKDGRIIDVEITSHKLEFKGHKAALVMAQDITERVQAEESLKESELKYRSLIECSSDAVFCVDENGQYKFTNYVYASNFEKTPEYFIGKTFWDVYPKENADYRYEVTKRVFQTGKSEFMEGEVPLPGKTLYFHITVNPIKDETGKVILTLTYATDITARKQAEERLVVERNLLSTLIDNLPDRIYVKDIQGRKIISNVADWQGSSGKTWKMCWENRTLIHTRLS